MDPDQDAKQVRIRVGPPGTFYSVVVRILPPPFLEG
jgi:hypothetical protein